MEQTAPTEHSSLVGGSSAARRLACSGSYLLEQQVPEDKGSSYAHEGTALHEMMTILLSDPDKEPYDLLPFEFTHKEGWSYTITDQIWEDLGQPALDTFLDYMDRIEETTGEAFKYCVEQRCEFPGIPGAFGTSDIVWRCGPLAGVWDWKFGFGKVSAEDNAQLLFYGAAARHTHPDFFKDVDEIELAIMQPQRDKENADIWVIVPNMLTQFEDDLQKAVEIQRLVADSKVEPNFEKGEHCKFARCKAICPLHVNPASRLASIFGERKDDEELAKAEGEPLRDGEAFDDSRSFIEMLPDLLDLAEVARDYADEVFARAQALALEDDEVRKGMEPYGWGLKPKRAGNLAWIANEDTIKAGLSRRGLKIDQYAPRKLMTPTQAKKALEKLGKPMPGSWAANPPSSGATLTRLREDTEQYESRAQKAKALAEKLGIKD